MRAVTSTYAVVPSAGRDCLWQCLDAVVPQADLTFLVQTQPFAIKPHPKLVCLPWYNRPLNISNWWNCGIKCAAVTAGGGGRAKWNVLVINDDVIIPPGLVNQLSDALRSSTAALAYLPRVSPGGVTPITGWCFMLRGEAGIKADPQFEWWFGDNDIEFQAREKGGAIAVAGCEVVHLHAGGHDPLMSDRIPIDAELWRKKWLGKHAEVV